MTQAPIFHGTLIEKGDFLAAVQHNCICKFGPLGRRLSTCPAHEAMVREQRFIDGLLWGRYMAKRLLREEFSR